MPEEPVVEVYLTSIKRETLKQIWAIDYEGGHIGSGNSMLCFTSQEATQKMINQMEAPGGAKPVLLADLT